MTAGEIPIPSSPEVAEEIERLRTFAQLFGAYHAALAREVPSPENIKGLRFHLSHAAASLLSQLSGKGPLPVEDVNELIEPQEKAV